MEAFLVDWSRLNTLLNGKATDAAAILRTVRERFPSEFEPSDYDENTAGPLLEKTLGKGVAPAGRGTKLAILLLCRVIGMPVDQDRTVNASFALLADAITGLPGQTEHLAEREIPGVVVDSDEFPVIGFVTPEEADAILKEWPEPDLESVEPEIYRMREDIESMLNTARISQSTLIAFWQ